ncbi:MAG: YqgE/AlgH family protein, partial [Acidobacteriota bacterium]
QGDPEARAFFGGPVSSEMGTLVYRDNEFDAELDTEGGLETVGEPVEDDAADDETTVRAAGMAFSQSVGDLDLVADLQPDDYRLYFGYAGWSEGQLEAEILRNDWLIAPAREDLIFCRDPDDAWRHAVESMGVDPDHLPAWTHSEHGLN